MAHGLQVLNQNGYLQVDSNHLNIALTGKRYVGAKEQRSDKPIYAIQPKTDEWMCPVKALVNWHSSGEGMVYEFDTVQTPQQRGIGIEIYTPNGQVAFSSATKNMKVIEKITMTDVFNKISKFKRNYGHKNIAIVPNILPLKTQRNYDGGDLLTIGFKITRNNDLLMTEYFIDYGADININLNTNLEILVIDTTLL